MASPTDLRFTKTHEWVRVDGDVATVGITEHAQLELGEITYVQLPESGESVSQNQPFGIVESVKAASDIYAPLDGEVVERNETLLESPELVNASPYGDAWFIKIKLADTAQVDALLDPASYDTFSEESA